LPKITSVKGRLIYNSRGTKTIEVDVISDNKFLGRVCAPSGASVGKHEAINFPDGNPEKSLHLLTENANKFLEIDSTDLKSIHDTIRNLDSSQGYSKIGGGSCFCSYHSFLRISCKRVEQTTV